MQAILVFLCLALPAVVFGGAEVYRWVDDEGQVHYSDRPSPGADRVAIEVTPPSSSPAPSASAPGRATSSAEGQPAAAAYKSLTIQAPGQDEVLWNIEGQLDVAVALQPSLQPGHTLQLLLDGQSVAELTGSTRARLSDVYRGQHTLQARIQDESGATLMQASPVTFFVQQTALGTKPVVNPPPVIPQPRVRP